MQQVRRARATPRHHRASRARGAGGCGAGGPRCLRGVGRGGAAAEPAGHGRAVRPVPPQGEPASHRGHGVRQWPPARERGGMNMKPYDELPWWCQILWPWFGPPWYEQVDDLDTYLVMYWCALHLSAAELAELLAGDDPPGEGYLAKVRRLIAARHQAEEIISHEYGPLTSDDTDDGDEDDKPARSGNGRRRGPRPPVVGGGETPSSRNASTAPRQTNPGSCRNDTLRRPSMAGGASVSEDVVPAAREAASPMQPEAGSRPSSGPGPGTDPATYSITSASVLPLLRRPSPASKNAVFTNAL